MICNTAGSQNSTPLNQNYQAGSWPSPCGRFLEAFYRIGERPRPPARLLPTLVRNCLEARRGREPGAGVLGAGGGTGTPGRACGGPSRPHFRCSSQTQEARGYLLLSGPAGGRARRCHRRHSPRYPVHCEPRGADAPVARSLGGKGFRSLGEGEASQG